MHVRALTLARYLDIYLSVARTVSACLLPTIVSVEGLNHQS